MRAEFFEIHTVPTVVYGAPKKRGYLFLHGQMGRKEEAEAFAQVACPKGYQVLSIDLPGHGARQGRAEALTPWAAVPEIQAIFTWGQKRWKNVSFRTKGMSLCQTGAV